MIVNRSKAGRFTQDVIPCGRCPGCIAARQNDYILRFYLAGKSATFLWFVTLTYRDESLPVLCKPLPVEEWSDCPPDVVQSILGERNDLYEFQKGFIVDNDSWLHRHYLSFIEMNRSKYEFCRPLLTNFDFNRSSFQFPCSL